MKSEPYVYSIDDLEKDGSTCWEGVRNYRARNNMRDMSVGSVQAVTKKEFAHVNVKKKKMAGYKGVRSALAVLLVLLAPTPGGAQGVPDAGG